MRFVTRFGVVSALAALAFVLAWPVASLAAEMRGITATEIKIGQTMPYSGPVSAFGALGKGEVGYFKMLNERGGINGRKVNLISLDDGYAPPKTVEQTRRLVESDEVALIFASIGTAHTTAIAKYLQSKNVPQLFIGSGASKFADLTQYPQATLGVQGPFRYEARLYARYALAKNPNAKFAVISQNDDYGRDYILGLKDVLGEKYDSVVTAATYEIQDPTIDSQIVKLKASGADVLVIAATPKFAAQSIRKVFEIGWKPMTFLSNVAVWVSTVMEPAGLEAGVGILSTAYVKDPDDPAWKDDPGVRGWREFMTKYVPEADQHDTNYVNAYNSAMALEAVLKACGGDHVDERGPHLLPFSGLQPAVRIDPELCVGEPAPRELDEISHLADLRHARRMDVVDAGADLVRIAVVLEGVEQFHLRARGLDRDHVGVHGANRVDDVVEFGIAHMGVDLGFVAHARGTEPEAVDRPVEIGLPLRLSQRQPLAQRGLVNLDHAGAGGFEIADLVADRERDLPADLASRCVVADERPVEDGDGAGQHRLHRLLRQRLCKPPPFDRHRLRTRDVAKENRRPDAARAIGLHPAVFGEDEA